MSTEERLGYAHTLAHDIMARILVVRRMRERGDNAAVLHYCAHREHKLWRRYDRITGWIYSLGKTQGYW